MTHHRVIWYITGAVVLGAALVFAARNISRDNDIPGTAESYYALALQHTETRSFAAAEEAYRRAIALKPEWSRPHNDLAILLRILNRLDEAEQEALAALHYGPDDVATHNNYANLLVEQGKLNEAEPYYLKAISLDPKHPKPYYNLACLYSLQGKKEQVYPLLKKAIALDGALRAEAQKDPDFKTLREDPEFRKILAAATPSPTLKR